MPRYTTYLLISLSILALTVTTAHFCDEEATDKFYDILNVNFNNHVALDRSIFSPVMRDLETNFDSQCGGEFAQCTHQNVQIVTESEAQGDLPAERALYIRTKTHPVAEKYKYTSGGINTRDNFVIKRTGATTTRLCIRMKTPPFVDNITPHIRLIPNNAYKKPQDQFDQFESLEIPSMTDHLHFGSSNGGADSTSSYSGHYAHTGEEVITCQQDEGELTMFKQFNNTAFQVNYAAQNMTKSGICAAIPNELKKTAIVHSTPRDKIQADDVYHTYSVEYSPNAITYYYDGKEEFKWDSPKDILVNNTSFYYLSIDTLLQSATIPSLDQNEYAFSIKSIRIIHDDKAYRNNGGDELDLKFGLIVLGIITAAAMVAFIAIFLCARAANKRQQNQQYEQQEHLLVTN